MDPLKPNYYNFSKYNVEDVAASWKLGRELFNVLKYTVRVYGKKNPTQDINKAFHYLNSAQKYGLDTFERPRDWKPIPILDLLILWKDFLSPKQLLVVEKVNLFKANYGLPSDFKQLEDALYELKQEVTDGYYSSTGIN